MRALMMLAWAACGVVGFGITLAHFQGKYPAIANDTFREDCGFATAVALAGPIGLFVAFLCSGFAERGVQFSRRVVKR